MSHGADARYSLNVLCMNYVERRAMKFVFFPEPSNMRPKPLGKFVGNFPSFRW